MNLTRRDFVAAVIATSATATAVAQSAGKEDTKGKPVYVVAEITVKAGTRDEFVGHFKDNVPAVLAEDGCHFYVPVVDVPTTIGAQGELRENTMTVVEKWETLDHLYAHLEAPHMATYREKVKDLVEGVVLRVMQEA